MNKILNFQAELINKIQLTDSILQFEYKVPSELVFTPGQFIGIRAIPTHTRAYSIVSLENNILTLIVDVRPGGIASQYFEKVQVGEQTNILGPYGIFKVKDTDLPKVFVSTGSGIAPFIPMIKELVKTRPQIQIYNFFGSKDIKTDMAYSFLENILSDKCKFVNCISQEDISTLSQKNLHQEIKQGRVTTVIPTYNFDWQNTEFYICGSSEMINNTKEVLTNLGADKVYVEKY